jgi:hypothetical protein
MMMTQLIVCRVRDDGDYETIAAIQNDSEGVIPALEWVLQIKEHMESISDGDTFVIFHREELVDVISDDTAEDITDLVTEAFNGGQPWL